MSHSLVLSEKTGEFVAKWIAKNPEFSSRLLVDAMAEYFLEDMTPFDYCPFDVTEKLQCLFEDRGYDINWYDFLAGAFIEGIELNVDTHCIELNTLDPMMSKEDWRRYLLDWAHEWRHKAEKAFHDAIAKYQPLDP